LQERDIERRIVRYENRSGELGEQFVANVRERRRTRQIARANVVNPATERTPARVNQCRPLVHWLGVVTEPDDSDLDDSVPDGMKSRGFYIKGRPPSRPYRGSRFVERDLHHALISIEVMLAPR
jgi:hypothetical protein